jgi:hypothetical protein
MKGIPSRVKPRTVAFWLALVLIACFATRASAQSDDTVWDEPLNLSQSGAASAPRSVITSDGIVHVIWQDAPAESFIYVNGDGDDWSEPTPVELPFGTRSYFPDLIEENPTPLLKPKLITDANDIIHGFWIDPQGTFYQSSVPSEAFADFDSWSERQQIAESALNLDVDVTANGRIHLAYVRPDDTSEFPAGVYYRSLDDTGLSGPQALFTSAYFRSVTAEETNVRIAVAENGELSPVYIAWDNQSLDKVFVARSLDNGQTWESPIEVDRREASDELDAVGPSNIIVGVNGNNVHLIWQAGHEGLNCAQYHQWSSDAGETWSEGQQLLVDFGGCPDSNQFIIEGAGPDLLLSTQGDEANFLAWDGIQWSQPQTQENLATFISPETFRQIDFDCYLPQIVSQSRLLVIGCGVGQDEDIWVTSRLLGDVDEWFPPPPIWSQPVEVVNSDFELIWPTLVADKDGSVHAFWSQFGENGEDDSSIHYARFDGEDWSRPVPILTSQSGGVGRLSAAIGKDGRLFAAWLGGEGEILFSQADVERALVPSDWAFPLPLSSRQEGIGSVDLAVDEDGIGYLAYSVPFNEQRGIYILRSDDNGLNWSEPVTVFDGASAGWDGVGPMHLALTKDGRVHVMWSSLPQSAPADAEAEAVYFTSSEIGGNTFGPPQLVVETTADWIDVFGIGDRTVYRAWREERTGGTDLRLETSLDGGLTWGSSIRIISSDGEAIAIQPDMGGQLHLIQMVNGVFEHRVWNGESWSVSDSALLPEIENTGGPESLVAAISSTGDLLALFITQDDGEDGIPVPNYLISTGRKIEVPEAISVPLPTILPTQLPTPQATSTSIPEPTPTTSFTSEIAENNGNPPVISGTGDPTFGNIITFLPAGLLVLLILAVALRVLLVGRR